MTKVELIAALTGLPDDGEIFVEPWPGETRHPPPPGELFAIALEIVDGDGWHSPAFPLVTPVSNKSAGGS